MLPSPATCACSPRCGASASAAMVTLQPCHLAAMGGRSRRLACARHRFAVCALRRGVHPPAGRIGRSLGDDQRAASVAGAAYVSKVLAARARIGPRGPARARRHARGARGGVRRDEARASGRFRRHRAQHASFRACPDGLARWTRYLRRPRTGSSSGRFCAPCAPGPCCRRSRGPRGLPGCGARWTSSAPNYYGQYAVRFDPLLHERLFGRHVQEPTFGPANAIGDRSLLKASRASSCGSPRWRYPST